MECNSIGQIHVDVQRLTVNNWKRYVTQFIMGLRYDCIGHIGRVGRCIVRKGHIVDNWFVGYTKAITTDHCHTHLAQNVRPIAGRALMRPMRRCGRYSNKLTQAALLRNVTLRLSQT